MKKMEIPLSENLGRGYLSCADVEQVAMRLTLKALGDKIIPVIPASCWSDHSRVLALFKF
jgi:hypothetical protein